MISKEDFIVVHALYEKGHNISEISKLHWPHKPGQIEIRM